MDLSKWLPANTFCSQGCRYVHRVQGNKIKKALRFEVIKRASTLFYNLEEACHFFLIIRSVNGSEILHCAVWKLSLLLTFWVQCWRSESNASLQAKRLPRVDEILIALEQLPTDALSCELENSDKAATA